MFNPLKQLGEVNKLRQEAKRIQDELKQIVLTEQRGRFEIQLSADMKVRYVKMNGEELGDLKDLLNDIVEKAQKKAAHKMQEMGGLSGLFGK